MKTKRAEDLIRSKISGLRDTVKKLESENSKLRGQLASLQQVRKKQVGLSKHSYLFGHTKYTIRDPIYGSIPLSAEAYKTLNCKCMQRLRGLKQNGAVHLVYTGSTHTRLSHSIGVYHLARMVLQRLVSQPKGEEIEPELGKALLAASLVHDVGHFPFSHALEELKFKNFHPNHEKFTCALISEDDELQGLITKEWGVGVDTVISLIAKSDSDDTVPPFLKAILNSSIDIDKMDYLQRDAYHAGVPYGSVEHVRLIESLRIDPQNNELTVHERGVASIESLLFAKYLMFRNVYWHHGVRIVTAMIKRASLDFILNLGYDIKDINTDTPEIKRLLRATDDTFLRDMKNMLDERKLKPPKSICLLERIGQRRLLKRAVTLNCEEEPDLDRKFRDPLEKRETEATVCEEFSKCHALKGKKLDKCDILIDVPEPEYFIGGSPPGEFADPPRIFFDDPPPTFSDGRVPWGNTKYISSFDEATLRTMEERIRKIRYVYNPDIPELKEIIRKNISKFK